ncbi:hypothetical protein SAMN05216464_103450 [Mucilaginibacter pineti]|uniref:Uncharacterized protein n=1 Tax=Mucilaginibacter pineti TaxID=1391627 RepID=A0A1G6ZPQ4_9SPHI|nr:hypothetical protein SAMN05216464_103450 [Mucilaginibacter pineti]
MPVPHSIIIFGGLNGGKTVNIGLQGVLKLPAKTRDLFVKGFTYLIIHNNLLNTRASALQIH